MSQIPVGNASAKLVSIIVAVASVSIYLILQEFQKTGKMSKEKEAEVLFDRFWLWRLKETPEFATLIGNYSFDDQLESYSRDAFENRKVACRQFIDDASKLLSESELEYSCRQNLKLFIAELNSYLEGMEAKGYLFPINYLEGVHLELSKIVSDMKYRTADDYKKLISRLNLLPKQVSEIIDLMREGIKLRMTNHAVSMNAVLKQLNRFKTSVEDSPFYKPLLSMPDNIDASQREELISEIREAISSKVLPSFEKLSRFLEKEYFKHLRPEISISSLPNGKKFYELCLRFHLGVSLSPEEVHQMGLEEVKRIELEMKRVIKELELNVTVKNFAEKLREDKDFYFKSGDEILEAYTGLVVNKIRPKLPMVIKNMPKTKLSIQRSLPGMENGPLAFYLGGTLDGRPGVFYVNAAQVHSSPKYDMVTLALHEAEPGHHLQISYMMELENLPEFRRYVEDRKYSDAPSRFPLHTAYLEGWGLYSEYLGYELDMYDDPYFEYGHLSYEMFRACRLVVDTGIHSLGWTRDEALNYMLERTALHKDELEKEIDRYITWPGQACAYKVGEMKIKELRKKAEGILGSKFDVPDFHDVILRNPGHLHLLEEAVNEYIQEHVKPR